MDDRTEAGARVPDDAGREHVPTPTPTPTPAAAGGEAARERAAMDPAVKAAGVWLHLFARTLKTCRLYDSGNPTVVKFRDELGEALTRLLAERGPVTYRFAAEDVTCEGQSLYPARSRD